MTGSTGARLGWASWAVCVVLGLLCLVLLAFGAGTSTPPDSFGLGGIGGLAFVLASLAFATVGALVASRVPGNAIGWIFCVTGLAVGAGDFAFQYADRALFTDPGLPGGAAAAWLQNLGLPPAFGLLGLSLLLFPDGRLPSRRWRAARWVNVAGMVFIATGYAFRSGPLDEPFDNVSNPLGIRGSFELMDAASGLGWVFMAGGVALGAVAMAVRLRRSRGQERQQLRWVATAAAVVGLVILAVVVSFFAGAEGIDQLRLAAVGLGFAVFPAAAGVAILKYRLYDLEVVIRRTLVYGALTATLALAYLGSVLVLQLLLRPLTRDSSLAIAGSTLAAAALVRPARARIQEAVDRRFYRSRYDATRTLEDFTTRLRDEVDLETLNAELRRVVRDAVQPAHVSLWLRGTEAGR